MTKDTKSDAKPEAFALFDRGVEAFSKITDAVKRNGTRNATVAVGITTLLVLLFEFATKETDYIPNQGELACLLVGAGLIIAALIITSLEYRWELTNKSRQKELINQQLRLEAQYNLERLKKTELSK